MEYVVRNTQFPGLEFSDYSPETGQMAEGLLIMAGRVRVAPAAGPSVLRLHRFAALLPYVLSGVEFLRYRGRVPQVSLVRPAKP